MRGIEAAVRAGGILHLWLHPIDLGFDNGELVEVLQSILEAVAGGVDRARLCVATMSAFAEA
jgi:hypothetical protein